MDPLAPLKSFDRLQRRKKGLAIPVAVVKKFGDDQAGNLAALIAYYGFFSLFPLLLVFVTILGFVLEGNPEAQQDVVDSALKQIPLLGDQIQAGSLKGSGVGLAVGLVGAILSGLGVTLAAQTAFNRVQAVPMKERPDFLRSRLRGLRLLLTLGVLQVLSTAATGLVSGGFGGVGLLLAGIALSVALNLLLFFTAFRLLTDKVVPTSELWPGIITAAVLWTVLQAVGGAYIGSVVQGAGSTYGTFATVIGLLTWLFLGARLVVLCAELNSVLSRELWPRSLFDPPTEADDRALAALARIEERQDREDVRVTFEDDDEGEPPSAGAR